ncbi:P-loop containing nucleoside triphosphate hydrolase protein [Cyathus striatus]|nr:P-loop containing nucleoside triphosphate hydrolase protein [Cyathus striatus]
MSGIQKIKIAARLRPRIQGEIDDNSVKICHTSDDSVGSSSSTRSNSFICVTNPRDTSQVFKFPFSSCYDENTSQEEIFQNDVDPLIDVVYSGVTVTIFAYGVTSSGKTHTMQGTKADPGIIPRVVRAMFDKKSHIQCYETSLAVSYMEIYKDEVYDLLVARENAPKLPVRENDAGMVFVANLTSLPLSSVDNFDSIYNHATRQRSVGATNLNRASSRSHAVLTIEARMLDPVTNMVLTGKMNLVDLAGSENNKLTGNDPSRMAESAAINKSLSVLGQVVHALNQGASRIPYRNSKLTRILQDALGGTSVGLLICNLAPGVKFRQDTLNTLNFAVRTKNVENRPVVNEHDNRPAPKPHFAAISIQPPAAKPAPAILQTITTSGSGSGSRPSRSRTSLVPVSKASRALSVGGATGYPPSAVTSRRGVVIEKHEPDIDGSGNFGFVLSEKDIDERISRAVEAEVARRLAEKELERQKEEAERRDKESSATEISSPKRGQTLPSGILTPLLKRHKDLDDELKARLEELEKKLEQGSKESYLADTLSPLSRKKAGRAYVALARGQSERGNLQAALDLYRKAETYVPENMKLKERIIEIEWSVKNGKPFVPSPKPLRNKRKKAKASKSCDVDTMVVHEDHGERGNGKSRRGNSTEFGMELTNTDSPDKSKRIFAERDDQASDEDSTETPPKRRKRSEKLQTILTDSDNEWVPTAPAKKGKQTL